VVAVRDRSLSAGTCVRPRPLAHLRAEASVLLPNLGEASRTSLSTALFVASAIGFGIAGFIVLFGQAWWRPLAVVSSLISLALLVLFWKRGLTVGAAIDIGVLVAVLWLRWPRVPSL